MTDTDDQAKRAAILGMMHGFPSSAGQITKQTLPAYMLAVEGASVDAVKRSCGQFLAGKVPDHNNAFIPTAAELSANARSWDSAIAQVTADRELARVQRIVVYPIGQQPKPPLEPLGPIKIEINGIPTDVSHLTFAEKEIAMKTGRMPTPDAIGAPDRPAIEPRLQKL